MTDEYDPVALQQQNILQDALQRAVALAAADSDSGYTMVTDWVCSASIVMADGGVTPPLYFWPRGQPAHVTLGHAAALDAYMRSLLDTLNKRTWG
jgi:hypothetical protein